VRVARANLSGVEVRRQVVLPGKPPRGDSRTYAGATFEKLANRVVFKTAVKAGEHRRGFLF